MDTDPQTWHYGVVAKWWAEFNLDGPEIAYFRQFVEGEGQPALDVACGTGRLLIPYLQAGLHVDGCDISEDMLALCRERAEREGLAPKLYAQATHELDLPRVYRTIIVCGAFGLGGSREHDVEGLRRLFEHLEAGGRLVLDNEVPYADEGNWQYWLHGENTLPGPITPVGERRRAKDGTEYELRTQVLDFDALSQCITYKMHADMWRNGEHVAEEEHVLKMTMYFTNEIVLMLEQAGFFDIALRAGYTDAEPTAKDDVVVIIARK